MGLAEAAGQAQARLDERQRGTGLPLAQQGPGAYLQHLSGQVVIVSGAGDGQRFLAVLLGDRVTTRILDEVSRRG